MPVAPTSEQCLIGALWTEYHAITEAEQITDQACADRREETVSLGYGAGRTSAVPSAVGTGRLPVGGGVILYHYTCPCDYHLGSILDDGLLRTSESHIGSDRPDVLP